MGRGTRVGGDLVVGGWAERGMFEGEGRGPGRGRTCRRGLGRGWVSGVVGGGLVGRCRQQRRGGDIRVTRRERVKGSSK